MTYNNNYQILLFQNINRINTVIIVIYDFTFLLRPTILMFLNLDFRPYRYYEIKMFTYIVLTSFMSTFLLLFTFFVR